MRSTNNPGAGDFLWDGSPKNYRPRRALRVVPGSPTRLLRGARLARCAACGNIVEWYRQPIGGNVPLHPQELPAQAVPAGERWHVATGLAYASGDGSPWCRIRHGAVCPAIGTTARGNRHVRLETLAQALAVNSRRLQDNGIFTPPASAGMENTAPPQGEHRAVVRMLCVLYLARGPLHQVRCVAYTRAHRRCSRPVLDPHALAGIWTLVPADSRPAEEGQLPLPTVWMAVYDLGSLSYADQLRWHAQRCAAHAAAPAAADAAMKEWEVFDVRVHHRHIHSELPHDQSSADPRRWP